MHYNPYASLCILTTWVSTQAYSSYIILNGFWPAMKVIRKKMREYWQMLLKQKKCIEAELGL